MATDRSLLEKIMAWKRQAHLRREWFSWPRDSRGKFLPHVGYPKGLQAWMQHNECARS